MDLFEQRKSYQPKKPTIFKDLRKIELEEKKASDIDPNIRDIFAKTSHQKKLQFVHGSKQKFSPMKLGVVFSGGQAPGGHNVISGLFDAMKEIDETSTLIGFTGGPIGIVEENCTALDEGVIDKFRNQGGFDLIGSGRDKIETEEQLQKALETVKKLSLDGLVVIGGDDSNTNAAFLAEYFAKHGAKTRVVGVPKTIDGDLKTKEIAISFGFDTAAKTYSEMIGNIEKDALSAKKYYHFIRVMGRSASHLALECALQTQPNMTLISEEVKLKKQGLIDLVDQVTALIVARAKIGKNYGIVIIPEGIIEFALDVKQLIKELNEVLAHGKATSNELDKHLSKEAYICFSSLPKSIQNQLLLDRDPHGNVQVSKIESEKLFMDMVAQKLKEHPDYAAKFSAQGHFFGYEGRAALPTNFDCDLCYTLGTMAALLVAHKKTGYICALSHFQEGIEEARALAVPIVSMIHLEKRKGKDKPVIAKALVELQKKPFQTFQKHRESWKLEDHYRCVGPIQFFGDLAFTDVQTKTLRLESSESST